MRWKEVLEKYGNALMLLRCASVFLAGARFTPLDSSWHLSGIGLGGAGGRVSNLLVQISIIQCQLHRLKWIRWFWFLFLELQGKAVEKPREEDQNQL